ncbi:CIA30 family protein [Pricia antarctica]|nr:CIA30 family protein [Pricia antarctica]
MSNSNKNIDSPTTENNKVKSDSTRTMLYSFLEQGKGKWRVQDDVVMGGRSDSQLKITENNHAHFYGRVSLENDGGFCSIHQTMEKNPYRIPDKSKAFLLRLKGDGKDYNFRVRTKNGRHSYGFTFSTKGDGYWESISIPFNMMEASYHGEPVEVPNYAGENVMEMQLLIGNQKEETFEIFIESIEII